MSNGNIKSDSASVTIPVRIVPPAGGATVSNQLLNDLQSFEKKCAEIGKTLSNAMSSAFAGASTGGHKALTDLSQRMSELTSVSESENDKRLKDHKRSTKAQLAEMERLEEAQKKIEENAKKRGELGGKLMTGAGELASKSVTFLKTFALSTVGSEEGREAVNKRFEKIEPAAETLKSGLDTGASFWELHRDYKEFKGLRAAGSAVKSGAAGAMPLVGEAASATLGAEGLAVSAASVATIGAEAVVGGAALIAVEHGAVKIGQWMGLINQTAESTYQVFTSWRTASADAEKSTRAIALKQDAIKKRVEQEELNARNANKMEESRGRRIEANLAVARVADIHSNIAEAEARSRDTMANANRLLAGGNPEHPDILGLNSLPPIESKQLESGLTLAAALQAQNLVNQTQAAANRSKAQTDGRSFIAEDPSFLDHFNKAENAAYDKYGPGPTPVHGTFRMLEAAIAGTANYMTAPQATSIVSGGTYSQSGTLLAQSEQLAKWQEKITQESEREFHLLEQRRDTLTQMLTTGSQMLQQAKDEVAAAQNASTARKAQLSMLSKDQQRDVADILARVEKGKASREDFLKLNALGINQGRIGRTINENLAKGVDPRLGKLYQDLGGNEDLDNALKRQKDITNALTATQTSLNETLGKVDDAHKAWLAAQTAHSITAQNIEQLKSQKEEFTPTNEGAAFNVKDAITSVVEKDLVKAITAAIRRASALINNSR